MQLVRLILLEPGTIQSHPNMGVGLTSKYRYMDVDDACRDLKTEIQQQIVTYMPELSGVEIDIKPQGTSGISLNFSVNGVLYDFSYNTQNGKLESLLTM